MHFGLNWERSCTCTGLRFSIKSPAQDLSLWAASKSTISLDMEEAMERWEGDVG